MQRDQGFEQSLSAIRWLQDRSRLGEAWAYNKQETFGDVFASHLFGVCFVECSGKESLSHSLDGAADRGDRHEAI